MAVFSIQLKAFSKDARKKAQEGLNKLTAQLAYGVFDRTPVRTGRARSNWIASIGQPVVQGIIEPVLGQPWINITKSREKVQTVLPRNKLGSMFWLSNNVDYIFQLEHGSSNQAPYGMVTFTLNEVTEKWK